MRKWRGYVDERPNALTFLLTQLKNGFIREIAGKESEGNGENFRNETFSLFYALTFIILQVQEWTHKLRKEGYQLDRQVRGEQ